MLCYFLLLLGCLASTGGTQAWSSDLWRSSDLWKSCGDLPAGATQRLGIRRPQRGSGRNAVLALAFSPDGNLLATGTEDGTVRVRNVHAGNEAKQMSVHPDKAQAVTFSRDGKYMASAGCDGTCLSDMARGSEIRRFEKGSIVRSVAFSPNNISLASASKMIHLRDMSNGKEVGRFRAHGGDFMTESCSTLSITYSPDGKSIASLGDDEAVRLWDVSTTHKIWEAKGHNVPIGSVAFSPDGRLLASTFENTIRLHDVSTGTVIGSLEGHSAYVSSVAFSANGKMIVSASLDGTVRLWEVFTRGQICVLDGHCGYIYSVAFSSTCRQVASGGADATVLIWDVTGWCQGKTSYGRQQLRALWEDLESADVPTAYRAVSLLVRCERESLPFLVNELVRTAPDANMVANRIADLDKEKFQERHSAYLALEKLGTGIEPALLGAFSEKHSLEKHQRIERLIQRVAQMKLREQRAILVLELMGTQEARKGLTVLSRGPSDCRDAQAALQRLEKGQ
jgi:WD domain, G-beta repeat/Anaphase-promoting complex subunit 4 WD40 domain